MRWRLSASSVLVVWLATPLGDTVAMAQEAHPVVCVPSDDESWAKLPAALTGQGKPLPNWARAVAANLPRTAAALLELDLAHRTKSPLAPKLRAAMRWMAANANGSAYAKTYALFDAKQAGVRPEVLSALEQGDLSPWTDSERAALKFVRKMSVASFQVTDEGFASLVRHFGDKQTAAMVLMSAYANFQDRLLICLDVPVEADGPLPTVEVSFAPGSLASKMSPFPMVEPEPLPMPKGTDEIADDPDWTARTYDILQQQLEAQRSRTTRLRVPTWDEVEKGLPKGFKKPSRIVWDLICNGCVPELAHMLEMYTCRCNYMTRISNDFQLTLERDNVFYEYFGVKPGTAALPTDQPK